MGTETPISNPLKTTLTLPWKTRITIFVLNALTDASRRSNGTVNRRIFRILESLRLKTPPNHKPHNGVQTSDTFIDASRNLWFRLFVPKTTTDHHDQHQNLPVVVFFHGGGFVYLAPDFKSYDDVCRRFARKVQAVVVSVNYRLAPEHTYPAQYEDGFDVMKFLDEHADVMPENADLSRCFLAGDSAGGNLAHHVALRSCESSFTRVKVIGVVALQPFFGGEERTKSEMELSALDAIVTIERTDWMWKAFMPDGDRDHEVINVSGPKAIDISKLEHFPPTMVMVAAFDPLKDWQIKYYEWLKNSGKEAYLVEYPTMFHAFYIFPELPESRQLVDDVKNFIHNQCSKIN